MKRAEILRDVPSFPGSGFQTFGNAHSIGEGAVNQRVV